MNALRLMAVFFRISAMNEMAYRANFWIQTFESLMGLGTTLAVVAVVFNQTDELGGGGRPSSSRWWASTSWCSASSTS